MVKQLPDYQIEKSTDSAVGWDGRFELPSTSTLDLTDWARVRWRGLGLTKDTNVVADAEVESATQLLVHLTAAEVAALTSPQDALWVIEVSDDGSTWYAIGLSGLVKVRDGV